MSSPNSCSMFVYLYQCGVTTKGRNNNNDQNSYQKTYLFDDYNYSIISMNSRRITTCIQTKDEESGRQIQPNNIPTISQKCLMSYR